MKKIYLPICFVAIGCLPLTASPASDADALLAQMTLDEKLGQMVQVDSAALHDKADVKKFFLGSVLSGGGSCWHRHPLGIRAVHRRLSRHPLGAQLRKLRVIT